MTGSAVTGAGKHNIGVAIGLPEPFGGELTGWRERLDQRIEVLEALRGGLTSCIGCGCLSLRTCRLANPDDVASTMGSGPQYLLPD